MPAHFSPNAPGAPPPAAPALPKAGRVASLDIIRGVLLVAMAINHIPSAIHALTQQPFGYPSAAEGFVFIAGLVVGLVYSKKWDVLGAKAATRVVLKRAAVVYAAHIATVAGVVAWMLLHARFSAGGQLPVASPWEYVNDPVPNWLGTLALIHQPGLLDVLPMYCGFLLLTPFMLWQLSLGRYRRVLTVSAVIWLATWLFVPPHPVISGVINTGAFNFTAWQFLFVAGLAAGHAKVHGRLPAWQPPQPLAVLLVLLVGFFFCLSHGWLTFGLTMENWQQIANKPNLAPLRLFNFAIIVILVRAWLRRHEFHPVFAPLELLGRHSLAVFSVHCVLATIILGQPAVFTWTTYGPYLGPVLMLAAMFATAMLAEWRRQRAKAAAQARPAATPAG